MNPAPSAPERLLRSLLLLFVLAHAGCSNNSDQNRSAADAKPSIVSLAPSITEMVYAIGAGDQLIGRTSACDYPASALEVQIVGAFGRPSLEMLTSLEPDIVLDADLSDEQMGNRIEKQGIRRQRLTINTPDDIPDALRTIGRVTGNTERADSLASAIENGLQVFRAKTAEKASRPKVYLEIWDDPLWTGGSQSYTSALIGYAGGFNIGDSVPKEYFEISPEWVITENPDIIACMYMSRSISARQKVMARPGWEHINAVRNEKVYDHFDNSVFLRPGPRVLEGIAKLQEIITTP